jgi:hypothetical protein
MKKIALILAALMMLSTAGCASIGPAGLIFTGTKNPGEFDAGETTNPGGSEITGEACAMSVLGLIAVGDWSVDGALKAAGAEGKTLKNVSVDHRVLSIIGPIFAQFCTRVTAQVAQ